MPSIDARDVSLSYRESGSGPLALFIHGFPLDARMWRHQLEGLADNRHCVAVDLRGSGRSKAGVPPNLSMEIHAEDMAAFIAALGEEQADVVALSMGGYVALALWERYPSLIRSLVLADTQAKADDDAGKAKRDATKEFLVSDGRQALAGAMAVALTAPDSAVEVRAGVREMTESTDYETIVAALEGMKQRPDRTQMLGGITAPTLIIVGDQDGVTPPAVAEAMADAIPGSSLEVISDAGHMTPMEQPDRFNTLVSDFWTRSD